MSGEPPTLSLSLPQMRYDIVQPLLDGRVQVEGIAFRPVKQSSMVSADVPALRTGEFGLWDLNVGFWLAAIEAGWETVALPVFSKRKPVYQFIFCRADAGIREPGDLAGKRIGMRQYRTAVTIWARGLLEERHGIDLEGVQWVAQVPDAFPDHAPRRNVTYVPERPSMADRLFAGEIDALMTDISDGPLFDRLERSREVARLFPDYPAEDLRLRRETGIFTPMHVIVMSRRVERERPDLAPRLFRAFEEAKAMAYDDIAGDRAGFGVVYLRERFREQMAEWGDPWAYGIAANRGTIDTFMRYNVAQGVIRTPLSDARIFAAGTLDT